MSRPLPRASDGERLPTADPVLQLMDDFERSWRSGGQARIDDYLQQVAADQRAELLVELVAVERQLGKGAFGTVFRATRLADDRSVAVKVVPLRGQSDASDPCS